MSFIENLRYDNLAAITIRYNALFRNLNYNNFIHAYLFYHVCQMWAILDLNQ